jgi:hypothetical protein
MNDGQDALTMAVSRRKPKDSVVIPSDQGSQFGSDEFNRCCKDNQLSPSMSLRGNCHSRYKSKMKPVVQSSPGPISFFGATPRALQPLTRR